MDFLQKLLSLSNQFYKEFLPHISIDCVVFGFDKNQLKVLMLKLKGNEEWALPGGYLQKNEDLNHGAQRILAKRTGVEEIYLHQFKTFGRLNRSESFFSKYPDDLWHKQRFISVGYYALIDYARVNPVPDELSDFCTWKDIDKLPPMMMDHQEIYESALKALRRGLDHRPIGLNLLPSKFTMPEIQRLYEIILGKKLNRGNFYRKMMKYGILNKLDESRRGGAHKAPILYTFNEPNYEEALRSGFKETW